MSFSSMNQSYQNYLQSQGTGKDIVAFKEYLLGKDTIIIPQMGELICSPWVAEKIHTIAPNDIKDKWYHKDGEVIYVIYSKFFPGIWEVKLFFDTTDYIKSQIIILKVGFIFIFFAFILQFFWGKILSRYLLKDLIGISKKLQNYSLDSDTPKLIECKWSVPETDEIHILARALNRSHTKIAKQTDNLKQFITDVSHEFKTPLMAMSSRLDLLEKKTQKTCLSENELSPFINASKNSISKLNTLLETLFYLTRSESEKWFPTPDTTELHVKKYFEHKFSELAENYSYKKLNIDIQIDNSLEWNINKELLSVVVDNLIGNALKFTPEKGDILIEANEKGFHISDSGAGVPEDERENVFEKFYRQDTNKEWFWIGLFLVKRITQKQWWQISIEDGELSGAKFSIYFS